MTRWWIILVLAYLLSSAAALADIRISQLPTAITPTDSDEVIVNQAGVSKKMTLWQILDYTGFPAHTLNDSIHRSINDSASGTTDLWSAYKIQTELELKANRAESAVSGHFAALNEAGDPVDSGVSSGYFAAAAHNHSAADINTGILPISRGGIGQTNAFTDGQLLIGRSSQGDLTPATLTAGAGIAVTNSPGGITITNLMTSSYPTGFRGSAPPVYASASTFTQAFIRVRDSGDTVNIAKPTGTTADIATTGVNGIARSGNLAGTVSVASGSPAITGMSTAFSATGTNRIQVGDVVCVSGAQCRRIITVSSDTALVADSHFTTTVSGATYQRGGRAPNTHLMKYDIAQANGLSPAMLLSTRNVAAGETLVDLPAGYVLSRQDAFSVRLDSAGNIIPFVVGSGWPYRPYIHYQVPTSRTLNGSSWTNGVTTVLSGGNAATFTPVNLNSFVPATSRMVRLHYINLSVSALGYFSIRATGDSSTGQQYTIDGNNALDVEVPTNGTQSIDYQRDANTATLQLDVLGYYVTEVP